MLLEPTPALRALAWSEEARLLGESTRGSLIMGKGAPSGTVGCSFTLRKRLFRPPRDK